MNWMIYVICIIDNFLNSKDFFFFLILVEEKSIVKITLPRGLLGRNEKRWFGLNFGNLIVVAEKRNRLDWISEEWEFCF